MQKNLTQLPAQPASRKPKQQEYDPCLISAFHKPGRTEAIPNTIAMGEFGKYSYKPFKLCTTGKQDKRSLCQPATSTTQSMDLCQSDNSHEPSPGKKKKKVHNACINILYIFSWCVHISPSPWNLRTLCTVTVSEP